MLKRRIAAIVIGIALMIATVGVSGIVADSLGLSVTSSAAACSTGSSTGGDC